MATDVILKEIEAPLKGTFSKAVIRELPPPEKQNGSQQTTHMVDIYVNVGGKDMRVDSLRFTVGVQPRRYFNEDTQTWEDHQDAQITDKEDLRPITEAVIKALGIRTE